MGDGYYEQMLIREQITRATGQRYLDGQRSDEAQYRMLMDNGIAFARQYGLAPGVALTAEQMSQLTTSIVWLVTQTVTLPDGATEQVLAPQVYLKVKQSAVSGNGTLLAGNRVISESTGEVNNSGTIAGREVTRISAGNVGNTGVIRGGEVDITAGLDIKNSGGTILGDSRVSLNAGRDIVSESLTRGRDGERWIAAPATVWVQEPGGSLRLEGMRDVTLSAGQAGSAGQDSSTTLIAGRNLTLNTVTTAQQENYYGDRQHYDLKTQTQEVGSAVSSGGRLTLTAGNNLNARAADVTAGGALAAGAGNNLTIESGESTLDHVTHDKWKKKGFLSKTTQETHHETHLRQAQGSSFSADTVTLTAGRDLSVKGSTVAGAGDVRLAAGNDLSISAAQESRHDISLLSRKKSGISGSGGLGVSVGSQSVRSAREGTAVTQSEARSLLGTSGGNVILSAGNRVTLSAADVVAARAQGDTTRASGHIDITGSDIVIIPGRDTVTESVKQEIKSKGLMVSVKAPFEDTVRNVRDIARGGGGVVDKVKSLGAEGVALGLDGAGQMLSVFAGSSKSTSESHYRGEFNSAGQLAAAGNIQMTATGKQGGGSGTILIAGSRLNAGEAVILDAKRDVNIITSTDTEQYSNSSKSTGWNLSDSLSAGSAVRAVAGGGKHASQLLPGGMSQTESNSSGTRTTGNASVIQGADIYVTSREGSVNIRGSQLTAAEDLSLSAGKGHITVSAGRDTSHSEASGSSKTLGTLGGDGYSATAGYSREKHSSREDSVAESGLRSRLTSTSGNIIAQAGKDIALAGTDVSAGKSVSLSGENVLFDVSLDTRDGEAHSSSSQYGVTASAGGWAVDAAKAAEGAARGAENGGDARLMAIRAGQAAVAKGKGPLRRPHHHRTAGTTAPTRSAPPQLMTYGV
jgi:filamentous hemagglutinin